MGSNSNTSVSVCARLPSLTHGELSGKLLPGAQSFLRATRSPESFFEDEELCCSGTPVGVGRGHGDWQGWGVRLSHVPGLLRQEVRLHVRGRQKWDAWDWGSAGGRAGGRGRQGGDEGPGRGDEEQRGHLLQGSPAHQGEGAVKEAGETGVAEGEGDGGARAQDDGGVKAQDVPPVHGRPLNRKKCQPNIPSVIVFQRDPK